MAGQYEKAISVQEAIESINRSAFVLPAIQRKFVWTSHQICVLFDSLMRDYPINGFMLWEVTSGEIKKNYKYYRFLTNYCQRFEEQNPELPTTASSSDFKAVIDGQQRLTSLYIGLCGTYAYKNPRVHWPSTKDESKLPPRKLYLDLKSSLDRENGESLMLYNFKFLTDEQFKDSREQKDKKHHWFCMHQVLNFPTVADDGDVSSDVVMPYFAKHESIESEFSRETLLKLYDVFRKKTVIHYFKETSQDKDHVLDVFIRTNSGGTKLDFSNLLMSIAVANWDGDFRAEVDSLIMEVYQNNEMGFYLERDWILKTCLMLSDADVRFRVENFSADQVKTIQKQWNEIKDCIRETFKFVRRLGINSKSLTSKNAVIPICYYLFTKHTDDNNFLYKNINILSKEKKQRETIGQWLYMVLLKGIFGGQADTILAGMRSLLKVHRDEPTFPLNQIIEEYEGSNKDLRFDEEYLSSLLDIQHGESRCRTLLHLLFPEMNPTETFHIDHLHPRSAFSNKKLKACDLLNHDENLMAFYLEQNHWNSIANLHLLNHSQNKSKYDKPLSQWASEEMSITNRSLLLDDEVSLEFENFQEFYEKRRNALMSRLKIRVFMTNSLAESVAENEDLIEEFEEENIRLAS